MHQLTDKKNKIAIYFVLLFLLSTFNNRSTLNVKKNTFEVNRIEVMGLSNKDNLQIKKKLNYILSKNLLFLDHNRIDKTIWEYNLVDSYTVKKIYPSIIKIKLQATKFISRTLVDEIFLIGSNGKLIKDKNENKNLPFLFGEFNREEFLKFKEAIDNSDLKFENFESISFYPSHRWDILTKKGILIKLPKKDLPKALKIADKIILDNYFKDNRIIDLRIPNHIIMKNE